MATLLITDINSQNSLLLVAGEREFLERISYPIVESNCIFDLPGIVSRKKQLIPYLLLNWTTGTETLPADILPTRHNSTGRGSPLPNTCQDNGQIISTLPSTREI